MMMIIIIINNKNSMEEDLLINLIVAEAVNKTQGFFENRKFITVLTKNSHRCLA
jgi:hypothetical protein